MTDETNVTEIRAYAIGEIVKYMLNNTDGIKLLTLINFEDVFSFVAEQKDFGQYVFLFKKIPMTDELSWGLAPMDDIAKSYLDGV